MTSRIAISSTGRHAQYVGTTRSTPPSAVAGSPTARYFNGTSDRMVGQRGSDLGTEYSLVMTFWRADGTILADDLTAARLFTQSCIGGSRIGLGINRDRLAVTYTTSAGLVLTAESEATVTDINRHVIAMRVTPSQIFVYLEGRQVLKVDAILRAPDDSLCTIGSDANRRFFKGYIDDLAIYTAEPRYYENWLRYYSAVMNRVLARDYEASPWGLTVNSAVLTSDGFVVSGSSDTPPSRARAEQAFRDTDGLGVQNVELRFGAGPSAIVVGLVNASHELNGAELGVTAGSWGLTDQGDLRNGSVNVVTGLATWGPSDRIGVSWDPATNTVEFFKNGVSIVSRSVGAGPWWLACSFGARTVKINSGQEVWFYYPATATGLYKSAWSRLASEFRHLRAGEVSALLNDPDLSLRDAQSGVPRGVYLDPAGAVSSGITLDPLDTSRLVGSGITVQSASWTAADSDFFFALAFSPTAADLVGQKILLHSAGKWELGLLDGALYAEVGGVQVGSGSQAFVADGRYFIGMLRGTTGKLMVWSPAGFLLQSSDPTVAQTAEAVWVGSDSAGANALEGKCSHLILSSKRPAGWKLDRLARAAVWDEATIDGLEPTIPTLRMAFEPSWRDVVSGLGVADPLGSACYYGFVAAQPDELTLDYRMVTRTGSAEFGGDRVSGFAPYARLQASLAATTDPAVVVLTDINDLDRVMVGGAALVGSEICRVAAVNLGASTVTIDRGCADTLPMDHAALTTVWFPDGNLGGDLSPFTSSATVDGKALARTALGEVPEASTPTDTLAFFGRLAKPYPPAYMRVNDSEAPADLVGTVEVTWRHRNKATQGSGLVAYREPSVAAALDVTYVVRMYDDLTDDLLAESIALPSTAAAYDLHAEFDGQVRVTVTAYQGGQASWQAPEKTFAYTGIVTVLLTTEEGEPLTGEGSEGLLLEGDSAAVFSSFSGHPAGSYRTEEEEEEEEVGVSPFAVDGIIGIPISELPANSAPLTGAEIFPIVKDGTNYNETLTRVVNLAMDTIPTPADGKSAYQVWLDLGNTGTEADFFASLKGDQGLPSNVSRRIQTVNSAAGAVICDWAVYDEIRLRLTGDVTLTFQGAVDGQGCLLKLQQDSAGGHLVTLPAGVRFNALLNSFVATSAPGLADKVGFIYDSGDSKYDLVSLVPGIF